MRRISSKNHDKEILNIVNNIIPECSEIYFIWYFYFSGFSLIAKALSKKPNIKLKILGIETDQDTHELVNENLRKRKYFDRLSNEVLEKDILDNRDEEDAYFIFKKIKDGTLEIKQSNNMIIQKNIF